MKKLAFAGLLLALGLIALAPAGALAQNEIFIPLLVYRTGPYAPNGVPFANGARDYLALIDARDGGINGVKIAYEECETAYDTKMGVECYEKLKGKGPHGAAVFSPLSTGITYELIPKARVDHIPVFSMGYGRADAADGKVFEWTFNFPDSYWSQASVFIRDIGRRLGGMEKLKGQKIALIYHNSPYGKEPIPALRALASKYEFQLSELPVAHPGQEQGATWLEVQRSKPDWILLWGWGVMNSVAIKSAVSISFPMDHMMGVWWSGAEPDVIPAGSGAAGYEAGAFHAPGSDFPVHADILKYVYKGNRDEASKNNFGEVLYNRGMINYTYVTEAIRTAMKHFGNKPLSGAEVRWGMENLDLTTQRIKQLGMEGLVHPIKITCANHEFGGDIHMQQWDGKQWKFIGGWIEPIKDVIEPLVVQSADTFAKENDITPRTCAAGTASN